MDPTPPIEVYKRVRDVLGTDYLSRPVQRAIETVWPVAYRAGREEAARDIDVDDGFEHRYERDYAARVARGIGRDATS